MAYFDVVYFNKNLSSPVPYEITGGKCYTVISIFPLLNHYHRTCE